MSSSRGRIAAILDLRQSVASFWQLQSSIQHLNQATDKIFHSTFGIFPCRRCYFPSRNVILHFPKISTSSKHPPPPYPEIMKSSLVKSVPAPRIEIPKIISPRPLLSPRLKSPSIRELLRVGKKRRRSEKHIK